MKQERLLQILRRPHISEKSAMAADSSNQYTFSVLPGAQKSEIKEAIEGFFSVSVESVKVMNVKGKTKRTRNGMGRRSDWKKAIVRLAEGQEIDFTVVE